MDYTDRECPCETSVLGPGKCRSYERCKHEELACESYFAWVRHATKKGARKVPSKAFYDKLYIYDRDEDESTVKAN